MLRESPESYVRKVDGHLLVDPGRGTATELAAIYRDVAVLCIEQQIRRVLVRPGDDDPAGERCLRNAMTTMVLAGLPRDLCTAGVGAKIFETEDNATRWLNGSGGGPPGAVA
jgi:hypothetical protein